MSTIAPRRLGSKAKRIASALVAAGLTAGVLAAVALAVPIDTLATVNSAGNTFQFAGQDLSQDDCVPGGGPVTSPELDWGENANQTQVTPVVTGTVCLQSTNHEARVVLEYRDNNHVILARYPSNVARGNGSALNTFNVNLPGPQVVSAAMNHVHIILEERPQGGAWSVVGSQFEDY